MPHINDPTRRQWLQALALGTLAPTMTALHAAPTATLPPAALGRKRLILLPLHGGNDGLNTLVPYRDPLYRHLRPTLALEAQTLLPLSDDVALHPRMIALTKMFQAGEVAVLQDVGYPKATLSHFESAAVWESAQPDPLARHTGWFGEVVMRNAAAFDAARFDAAALSFDQSTGFARGRGVPVLMAAQNAFEVSRGRMPHAQVAPDAPPVVQQLANLVNDGQEVQARLAARLRGIPRPPWKGFEEPLEVQVTLTDWLVANGAATPLIRIFQEGYDTHAAQRLRHDDLLIRLDAALARLRQQLQASGAWNDTVVMVHSEFGRRPAENGQFGTDHGSAGPVFLIGGRVRGGLYGQRAALDDLDGNGNLKFSTDFRRIYATLVDKLWQLPVNPFAEQGHAPLDIALA